MGLGLLSDALQGLVKRPKRPRWSRGPFSDTADGAGLSVYRYFDWSHFDWLQGAPSAFRTP